jgi:hypothetical protein
MKLDTEDLATIERRFGPLWAELAELAGSETGGSRLYCLSRYTGTSDVADEGSLTRYLGWSHLVEDSSYAAEDTDNEPILFALLVSYGDYSSTTDADAANYRYLFGQWAAGMADPLLYNVGPNERDGIGLAVRIGDSRWSENALTDLIAIMNGLVDYPLISDETHSEYEHEKQEEWWDGCHRDLLAEIDDEMIGDDEPVDLAGEFYTWESAGLTDEYADDPRDRDDLVREVFYGLMGEGSHEWTWESATSIIPRYSQALVRDLIETLFVRPAHTAYVDRHTTNTGEWCEWGGQPLSRALSAVRENRCPDRCYASSVSYRADAVPSADPAQTALFEDTASVTPVPDGRVKYGYLSEHTTETGERCSQSGVRALVGAQNQIVNDHCPDVVIEYR